MFKRNSLIVSLLFILNFSPQLVLADVYKCVSSSGAVSYSEEKCKEVNIQKNGRWTSVEQREKELHEKLVKKTSFAKAQGMSDAEVKKFVAEDVYKCTSSTGKVSYSEKRCKEGHVKRKERWESVEEHEAQLHQNILNKIKVAGIYGMLDANVILLNSVLKADYENLGELNYSYEQWLQIGKLLQLRSESLRAVSYEISGHPDEASEVSNKIKRIERIVSYISQLTKARSQKEKLEYRRLIKRQAELRHTEALRAERAKGNGKVR